MLAVLIFALIAIVLFYLSQIRFYSCLKKNLKSITLTYKGSVLYSIANIIMLSVCALALASSITNYISGDANFAIRSILPDISLLLGCVLFICNTIMALSYRKHIRKTIYGVDVVEYDAPADLNTNLPEIAPQPQPEPKRPEISYQTYDDLDKQQKNFCQYCRANIDGNTIFCGSCGRKIK